MAATVTTTVWIDRADRIMQAPGSNYGFVHIDEVMLVSADPLAFIKLAEECQRAAAHINQQRANAQAELARELAEKSVVEVPKWITDAAKDGE